MSDRWWETETAWFSFHVPERRLGGWLYTMVRPNIGTVAGGAWVWDDTAWLPWDVPLQRQLPALQLPAGRSTCATPSCRPASRSTSSSRRASYDLGYDDGDRLERAPALRRRDGAGAAAAVGSTFGSAHHFDQFGHVTGDVVLARRADRRRLPRDARPHMGTAARAPTAPGGLRHRRRRRRRTASSPSPTRGADGTIRSPTASCVATARPSAWPAARGPWSATHEQGWIRRGRRSRPTDTGRARAARRRRAGQPDDHQPPHVHRHQQPRPLGPRRRRGLGRGPGHVAGAHVRRPPAGRGAPRGGTHEHVARLRRPAGGAGARACATRGTCSVATTSSARSTSSRRSGSARAAASVTHRADDPARPPARRARPAAVRPPAVPPPRRRPQPPRDGRRTSTTSTPRAPRSGTPSATCAAASTASGAAARRTRPRARTGSASTTGPRHGIAGRGVLIDVAGWAAVHRPRLRPAVAAGLHGRRHPLGARHARRRARGRRHLVRAHRLVPGLPRGSTPAAREAYATEPHFAGLRADEAMARLDLERAPGRPVLRQPGRRGRARRSRRSGRCTAACCRRSAPRSARCSTSTSSPPPVGPTAASRSSSSPRRSTCPNGIGSPGNAVAIR